MFFVELVGTTKVVPGGRSGTPLLQMTNITNGNALKVTATFIARTTGTDQNNGFTYSIKTTTDDALPLTQLSSTVQGNIGFQSTTLTAIYRAQISSQTGVDDVDFEVLFEKGDMDGQGEIGDFLLTGEVITLREP